MSSALEGSGKPVLVIGGTGHYGRRIVASLLGAETPVRVLSRSAASARAVLGERVEIVEGDITSADSRAECLRYVRSVVIAVSAFTPKLVEQQRAIERDAVLALLDEMARGDTSRVVYISVYDIDRELVERFDLDDARIKLEIERLLEDSNLNWTVLGAAPSMELFFSLVRGGKLMVVPGGGPPSLPTVSARDVGEIAAQCALRDDLGGMRIRMTGPEALGFAEAARRISSATGRQIHFRPVPMLPIETAALLARTFNPYLQQVVAHLKVLKHFPQAIAEQVPEDHRRLLELFSYEPTTLETEARERLGTA